MCVSGPIFSHKNVKGSIVQQYKYHISWEQNIVPIIRKNGVRAILPLFFNNYENEYEQQEMEMGVAGPIFNQKLSKALWDKYTHTPQDGSKIFWQLFIFMELDPFYYYIMITKTLNMSHKKIYIGVSGLIFTNKNTKGYMGEQ